MLEEKLEKVSKLCWNITNKAKRINEISDTNIREKDVPPRQKEGRQTATNSVERASKARSCKEFF
jgi:hypothetical protein